ncbi:tyrosine-type recombinase/integrase [Tumebacillus permanentifrigoris]|uniref:Integrase/recombinase XerD n=1 Tax=Tumebacillus permanentifrigoris TaxID=378543 RepID=A0A316D9W7_9BACL|nr:tyrosine-type recombinase/integrase [Tumebacillus permanentifrigoris]PWK14265.1 integrase/recombinase XerD [Tumebacillus permanentifrigoris]
MSDKRTGRRPRFERKAEKVTRSLEELFQVFYDAKVSEGVSKRTLETYRENFRFLCDFLDRIQLPHDVSHVDAELLRRYQSWMLTAKLRFDGHEHKSDKEKTVGLSPVTVNTRTKNLRTMFRFLRTEGLIEVDPWEHVRKVEEPESEIKVLTVEQLQKLLQAPNQRSYAGFRDFVLMYVLIDGFMRINEAVSLQIGDIDFDLEMVSLRAEVTKTKRSRMVPLQRSTMKLLKELINESEEFGSDYVFLTNYGEPLTANQFRHRLKEHAKQAGLSIRVHPHLFRHTSATIFLEEGGEVRHLAKILGHADLRMVMRYTHLSNKSIKSQHERFSPLNAVAGKLEKDRKILR